MANAAVRATPQSSLLPLFLRHFQPFPAPQPIHPFDVHAKSFAPQQRPRSTVAIAWMAPNQLQHPLHQGPLAVAFLGHVSLRGPRLFDHLAGPALRHLPRRLRFFHRLLSARRAHHFPRNVSSRICLSRVRSATSFFSRPFSTCSSLSCLASLPFIPPYWFRQRWKVASTTSNCWHTSAIVLPSDNIRSASRSLRMICSGLCLLRFIMSLLAQFLGSRDSQDDWIKFRGAGHPQLQGQQIMTPALQHSIPSLHGG